MQYAKFGFVIITTINRENIYLHNNYTTFQYGSCDYLYFHKCDKYINLWIWDYFLDIMKQVGHKIYVLIAFVETGIRIAFTLSKR